MVLGDTLHGAGCDTAWCWEIHCMVLGVTLHDAERYTNDARTTPDDAGR